MSSKTDSAVKLAIVFFISLLSFSIGTFVGKKYSDNQYQLSALEPQKSPVADTSSSSERNVASVEPERTGAMTDEEIAKLAEEFVAEDTVPALDSTAHENNAINPAHQGDKHAPITNKEEASEAARNVASGKSPSPVTPSPKPTVNVEGRVPSSLPKDVAQYAVGKFTVQLASYSDEDEAIKMATDLKSKGYTAFYVPASVKGKTWYRVSVGQFTTQKEAQNYRADFMNKTKIDSAIVQKISE